ncbi:MAG: hypothetical protein CMH52_10495 [Myxococcales bacterium]|nr:hypothetical protein [Myxococcales bacterium]
MTFIHHTKSVFLTTMVIGFAFAGCGSGDESSTVYEFQEAPGQPDINANGTESGDSNDGPNTVPTDGLDNPEGNNDGSDGTDGSDNPGPSDGNNVGEPEPPVSSGAGILGAACTQNSDCETGLCFTGMPGGYCSKVCESAADCGATGSCWTLGQQDRICLLNCTDSSECRDGEGYVCDGDNTCFPSAPSGGSSGGGDASGEGRGVGPGAPVGGIIQDFSLMNCGTGELVSMQSYFQGQQAGMFVLTAGWCGACAQWVPQILDLLQNPNVAGLKVAFVLGEDPSYAQPTQRYCQQYGNQNNIPADNLFMDHNGSDSFTTVFANMQPYVTADGSFGLPFNAMLDPETFEYIYADRGPGGDINAALNRLLAP